MADFLPVQQVCVPKVCVPKVCLRGERRVSAVGNKEQPSFHTTLDRGISSGPAEGELISDTPALPH